MFKSSCLAIFATLLSVAAVTSAGAGESELVSIGTHKLDVRIQGEGAQTVVFESGLGHDLSIWSDVAEEVSQFATVVSYSRAGYGQSENSDQPRTLVQIATELDQLLVEKKLEPPYILVGHSAGGFYIRKYAEQYPSKVKAFVFVDATPEQILLRLRELDRERAIEEEAVINSMTPDRVKPEDIYFSKITQSGKYPATADLPDVPAALITAMKQEYPQFLMHTIEGKQVWRDLQAAFIMQFTNNLHIISSVSGHNVHRDQPELVVDAIKYVMRESAVAAADDEQD